MDDPTVSRLTGTPDDRFVGQGVDTHGVLEQSEKQQAAASGAPSVEAEAELIKVIVEVLLAGRTLVGTHQPALEQGHHQVDPRHKLDRRLSPAALGTDADWPMVEALLGESRVTLPRVCMNNASGDHNVPNEATQDVRAGRFNPSHPHSTKTPTFFLHSHRDERFQVPLPPSKALFHSTHGGLVHLDRSLQSVTIGPDHGSPQFVQPSPGRFVTPKAQVLLKRQGAGSVLLAGDQPDRLEPEPQRLVRVLKNGAGRYATLMTARRALHNASASERPAPIPSAPRAPEPVRPAQPYQQVAACRLRAEPFDQLRQGLRILVDDGTLTWATIYLTHHFVVRFTHGEIPRNPHRSRSLILG